MDTPSPPPPPSCAFVFVLHPFYDYECKALGNERPGILSPPLQTSN